MFHYVDAKTGESTITCHSSDPNLFKYISKATPALKVAKEQHQVIEKEDSEADNYWEKISKNAAKEVMASISYLSVKFTDLPDRQQEVIELKNSKFTNTIKQAMISNTQRRLPIIRRMQNFFSKHIKSQQKDKEQYAKE